MVAGEVKDIGAAPANGVDKKKFLTPREIKSSIVSFTAASSKEEGSRIEFNERVLFLRENVLKMTQAELAQSIGLKSGKSISRIECGTTKLISTNTKAIVQNIL